MVDSPLGLYYAASPPTTTFSLFPLRFSTKLPLTQGLSNATPGTADGVGPENLVKLVNMPLIIKNVNLLQMH
uniref:Uncharacterized protein n=1 Tax=Anguilla anguilla TaxID=7936 RepID=A0A0E9WS58_ANGAN